MTTFPAEPTPSMRAVLDRIAVEDEGLADTTLMPPAEGRAQVERVNRRWNQALPQMAEVRFLDLGLTDHGRLFVPREDDGRGAILFVHGGGWAFCSMATHERCARALADAARAPVAIFDYRLAPEHPFPAGREDCATAWAAFRKAFPDRALGLAGDSAGANLALSLMLDLRPDAQPGAGLLFYGVYDDDFESPSYRQFADGPALTRGKMQRYFDWYAPPEARRDPRVAPLEASDEALAALPPLFLNIAGLDPLRSDTERLAGRLVALGRQDELAVHEGVVHGFMQMTEVLPEAREAVNRAGEAFGKIIRK